RDDVALQRELARLDVDLDHAGVNAGSHGRLLRIEIGRGGQARLERLAVAADASAGRIGPPGQLAQRDGEVWRSFDAHRAAAQFQVPFVHFENVRSEALCLVRDLLRGAGRGVAGGGGAAAGEGADAALEGACVTD